MEDEVAYRIEATERGFEIISAAGYSKIVCPSEEQAGLYLQLMLDAYEVGRRAGYRQKRRLDGRSD